MIYSRASPRQQIAPVKKYMEAYQSEYAADKKHLRFINNRHPLSLSRSSVRNKIGVSPEDGEDCFHVVGIERRFGIVKNPRQVSKNRVDAK